MGSNVAEGCLPVAQTTFRKQRALGRVGSRIAQSKRQSGKIVIAGERDGKTWSVCCIVESERSMVYRSVRMLRQHVLLDQHGGSEGRLLRRLSGLYFMRVNIRRQRRMKLIKFVRMKVFTFENETLKLLCYDDLRQIIPIITKF